ncbi:hypothetical protein CYMTET_37091 [Cymbomonas tetramitiformis]|uniref:Solute-binding protein family 3/N-terminal domain-containing protein n=1 Tax=Cymbomonas tetramitiformis TaxID=36881 RepID=A0AAE0CGF6_9CHLO|nr:hypothetical protein CYMTET_37091 [Cymbomonas tetramitiformis]
MSRPGLSLLFLALLGRISNRNAVNGAVNPSPVRGACMGRHIRLGIWNGDYSPYWNVSHPEDENRRVIGELQEMRITGHLASVVDLLAMDLAFTYTYFSLFTYTTALDSIANGTLDAFMEYSFDSHEFGTRPHFGNGQLWGLGTAYVYSQPLYRSNTGAVVRQSKANTQLWRFLDPFTTDLWFALGGCVLVIAIMKVTLRLLQRDGSDVSGADKLRELNWKGVAKMVVVREGAQALYHSLAVLLQGDDYDWASTPERILRAKLSWLPT